jgi:hypothetical protein
LSLPAFGSEFVVFSMEREKELPMKAVTQSTEAPVTAEWRVTFQRARGAPEQPISITDLTSWTEWPEPGVRYFSGTATYRADVVAPTFAQGEQVLLRFSDVREIARVRVNGHDAGTVWAKPFTLRVDPWLKPGENSIEIAVTNLWPNRIIGDLQPGAVQHYTETNITKYRANSPLVPSGLIGPVSLETTR